MNQRHQLLSAVWPDEKKSFAGIEVFRPTSHRLNVLMRRGNRFVSESPREQTDLEATVEWLFVLSQSKEALTKLFLVSDEEWALAVDEFFSELPDDALLEFSEYVGGVMQAMNAGITENEGKPES